ncbi:signal recognition particle protein [Candidatus Acetothermia bacterium]|nr:signal recognition particle protein [Candidatus Acetothermia bacterium]MBI3643074.1 signal recognition particle protein [Candidatus Acetothermia bacterium]
MFDSLSQRLNSVLTNLRRKGKLTEKDLDEGLREVRLALLEADVNYKVVKRFVDKVKEKALGQNITESLTPGQQVIMIVRDELVEMMGKRRTDLNASQRPSIWMMVGLQGSGKTTTTGKLARYFKAKGKKIILAATDIQRPAAVEQLEILGKSLDIPVYTQGKTPLEIARGAKNQGIRQLADIVIIDTAGRLQINEELMEELRETKNELKPNEVLIVADAMTGQEAVSIAEAFNQKLSITGIILTKMDGDARGGAAISMVEVTGRPIVFMGVGEKLEDFEPFHPDRLGERILGMGDVLTLIEEVESKIDVKKAQELAKRIEKDKFDLEDFGAQLAQVRSLGPLDKILDKIPGLSGLKGSDVKIDEKELIRVEAIIQSMTPEERRKPDLLNGSRKKRIAKGSGTDVTDVNRVLKKFKDAKKMMQRMKKMKGRMPPGGFPF